MSHGRSFICILCLSFIAMAVFLMVLNLISYQAKLNSRILELQNNDVILQGETKTISETYCADITFESDVYRNFNRLNKNIKSINDQLTVLNKSHTKSHKSENDHKF